MVTFAFSIQLIQQAIGLSSIYINFFLPKQFLSSNNLPANAAIQNIFLLIQPVKTI
jgi:hypothetical protein